MERGIKNPEKRKQKLILARAMDLPQGKVASRAPSTAKVRMMSHRRERPARGWRIGQTRASVTGKELRDDRVQ